MAKDEPSQEEKLRNLIREEITNANTDPEEAEKEKRLRKMMREEAKAGYAEAAAEFFAGGDDDKPRKQTAPKGAKKSGGFLDSLLGAEKD